MLAVVVGEAELQTSSHHHQGVDRIGDGAVVAAPAVADGRVEALEWPGRRFALGVQWHPERPRLDAFFLLLVQASAAAH